MSNQQVQYHTIDSESDGQRLDNFLIKTLRGVPKTRIYNLIRRDEIRVNKKRTQAKYKLNIGDIVRIAPIRVSEKQQQAKLSNSNILQQIIYQDANFLVIDKPAGLAVHGGSNISLGLIEQLRLATDNQDLQLVHRLDRETSGLILLSKKRKALLELQQLITSRKIHKGYQCVVAGNWPPAKTKETVNLKKIILANNQKIVKAVANGDGQTAETRFKKLASNSKFSLLQIKLMTGRTHQIRVHCQFNGHPIVGDDKYGFDKNNKPSRLYLHADKLEFNSQLLGKHSFNSKLPPQFFELVKN